MGMRDKVAALRTAATAGDAGAACELGRLLCLVPADPDDPADPEPEYDGMPTWPGERWLRAAVAGCPEDVTAKTLLAGVLLSQLDFWQNLLSLGGLDDGEEDDTEAANERRAVEARRLYSDVLRADPGNPTAAAGIAVLAWMTDADSGPVDEQTPTGYSYYSVDIYLGSGSIVYWQRLIAADPDEVRWACDTWLALFFADAAFEDDTLTLTVHEEDVEAARIPLGGHYDGAMDWSGVCIPSLTGRPLPPGHPVGLRHLYGYTSYPG